MSLGIAFKSFFKALQDKEFSARVGELLAGGKTEKVPPPPTAGQLLAVLQREGRFVDFLQEDLKGIADAQIGAVARTLHEGCRKVVTQYLTLEPVRSEEEGAAVTVEPGFDPAEVRLVGNVVGDPPFQGTLRHHGWKLTRAELPEASATPARTVLVPAEVELS